MAGGERKKWRNEKKTERVKKIQTKQDVVVKIQLVLKLLFVFPFLTHWIYCVMNSMSHDCLSVLYFTNPSLKSLIHLLQDNHADWLMVFFGEQIHLVWEQLCLYKDESDSWLVSYSHIYV